MQSMICANDRRLYRLKVVLVCLEITHLIFIITHTYLIFIIKSEVWIIDHCLGLGHETMLCVVCLTMLLCSPVQSDILTTLLHLCCIFSPAQYFVLVEHHVWVLNQRDGIFKTTRATFETSNYHRRPWDRYTAPIVKGAEHPPLPSPDPPPQKKKKKKKNEKLSILVIGLVEKIGRTVKQSSDLKTSSGTSPKSGSPTVKSFTFLLILFVCHVHSGSQPIFMVQSHFQYCCQSINGTSTSLLKRSVSIKSIS